jgi:hypothetical protein
MRSKNMLVTVVLSLIVSSAVVCNAAPVRTGWTYQGRLMDNNNPGEGVYDFQFKLFDDPYTGTQQGSTVDVNDLDVIDGYFTVELDFGSSVFNGNARWLEISVRPGDSIDVGDYVTLNPRQEVTPTPYSLQTRGIFVGDTGNVGIGTTNPYQKLHIMEGGIAFTDSVNPIDERLLYLGITGIGPDSRGYKFSWRNDDGSLRSDAMILDRTGDVYLGGNVGIGTTSPTANLEIAGDMKMRIEDDITLSMVSGIGNSSKIALGQRFNNESAVIELDNTTGILRIGRPYESNSLTIDGSGNVGIGTSNPLYNLHIYDSAGNAYVKTESASGYAFFIADGSRNSGLTIKENGTTKADVYWNTANDSLGLAEGGMERLSVKGGNVGIGTTNPAAKLDVVGSSTDAVISAINSSTHSSSVAVYGSSQEGYGVKGTVTGNATMDSYGVYGRSSSPIGTNYGVYGAASDASSGLNCGVYGIGYNPGTGNAYAGYFEGDVFVKNNISAYSYTDRTPYPPDLATAYQAVMSMERLPDGQYDENNKEAQLDHSLLSDFIRSKDGNRDLSATVSCHNEVLKDLINKQEELSKANTYIEQLQKQNELLEARLVKLEATVAKMNATQKGGI